MLMRFYYIEQPVPSHGMILFHHSSWKSKWISIVSGIAQKWQLACNRRSGEKVITVLFVARCGSPPCESEGLHRKYIQGFQKGLYRVIEIAHLLLDKIPMNGPIKLTTFNQPNNVFYSGWFYMAAIHSLLSRQINFVV